MNDLTRASHDEEIERLHERMSSLNPESEEYSKILKNYDVLIRSANEDDKIQVEAKAEELRIEADADKMRQNADEQKTLNKVNLIIAAASSVTTIVVYVMLCISNKEIQKRSIQLEMDGFAHTTRSDKYLLKMPNHKV